MIGDWTVTGNCERMWASKVGFSYSATSNFTFGAEIGLAVFRTAGLHAGNFHVKVLYRVIPTYQPKGPEALQSNIYLLNFGKFEWTVHKS